MNHPECKVIGIFTQPDRPAGRGRKLQPSPVKEAAEAAGIPVYTPRRLKGPEALEFLQSVQAEMVVVCAYGRILPDQILNFPPLGCYNLHFSLLPRWRGASPIQAALLAGDAETGVSLQRIVQELDAGAIVAETKPLPIEPKDTADSLGKWLAEASAELLTGSLPLLLGGNPPLREQDTARATFCGIIQKEAGAVDWEAESAFEIERKMRAYTPWPGCYSFLMGRRVGLIKMELAGEQGKSDDALSATAAPGILLPGGLVLAKTGMVRLLEVKPEGKKSMPFASFLNGNPRALGQRFKPDIS